MNENRLKKVKLSSGELDFGTISRGKCVFFMFRDGERNNYYGPDEQTNKLSRDFDGFEDYCTDQGISSDDRGVYHFGVNNYLCNGAWASVNFNIPGIIKVMVKADDDADFHEIVAGSDYRFSNNVRIKLAYNSDFINSLTALSDEQKNQYAGASIVYETDGTSPNSQSPVYDDNSPIELTSTAVLNFALKSGDNIYGANSGVNVAYELPAAISDAEFKQFAYVYNNESFFFDYSGSTSDAIYSTVIRDLYQWSNSFIKTDAEEATITLKNPLPYVDYLAYTTIGQESIKFGFGSPVHSWQTWVSDDDYFIPSSLAGVLDFYIYSDNEMNLYRVNWLPKNMPVLVRYRNLSVNENYFKTSGSAGYFSNPCTPQTFAVYKGDPSHARASDGGYRLGDYNFYNFLHYYEDGTHAVPSEEEQYSQSKYYFGLAATREWHRIVSGYFSARKAFLISATDYEFSDYDSSNSGSSKPLSGDNLGWGLTHDMDSEASGIISVRGTEKQADSDVVYDMQGRRISTPTKGIYIKNGQKYVVK